MPPGIWDMPQRSPQRAATDSAWNSIEPLSGALFDLNTTYEDVTGPARPPEPAPSKAPDPGKAVASSPEIIDLENYDGAGGPLQPEHLVLM
jgi:hypothetical protein